MHKKEEKEYKYLHNFFSKIIGKLTSNRVLGVGFLLVLIITFFLSIAMFYTTSVAVKMLPLDNKNEFGVVVDLSDGAALSETASTLHKMAEVVRKIPEVVSVQSYAGTSKPFDFNGLVRHYYLRQQASEGELHINLIDKSKRHKSSHDIALEVRELLKQIAVDENAKYAVVEMPPGPPVLRPVVAEVYGPDRDTRHKLASDLTQIFKQTGAMSDIDNLMRDEYPVIDFVVNSTKASSLGVDTRTIQRTLSMVLQDSPIGSIRLNNALEESKIVLRVPLSKRSQLSYIIQLPIPTKYNTTVPLSQLGSFEYKKQDDLIYHKDLFDVEYVLGEPTGRLSAPIYAMFAADDALSEYKDHKGNIISGKYIGIPEDTSQPSFAWAGEWTVTYETFRDMGLAFMIALVVIYMLVVWQFGNFIIPAVIMAPIPLTLLGIIPGHWLLGAEFTATSMIGWIALAGIIVRNSILLIDFTVQEYAKGVPFFEAVINSCSSRTRPILITAFALVGGSSVILSDPIFQGMAISLLFGVMVSTILTLIVIPLGTLAAGEKSCKNIAINMGLIEGDANADDKYNQAKTPNAEAKPHNTKPYKTKTKTHKEPSSENAKKWINTLLKKDNNDKIDSNILLKNEDKS